MKILVSFILASFFMSGCSGDDSLEGLWKFPGTAVWINIDADGSVFQCRMPDDVSTITSHGVLTDNTIIWERIWVEDSVRKSYGTMYLKGPHGEFGYKKAKHPMNELCLTNNEQ